MKILDRYIQGHLTKGFLLVLLVLVSIFSFLEFVEELDSVNLGKYDVIDAIIFVILTVPERALWLVPVSALLGCLIALSVLDQSNELRVIRAAGVPIRKIRRSILKATSILLLIVIIFAQFISPNLGERAWRDRALAIAGDIVVRKDSGTNFWFRDGRRFISIRDMIFGRIPTGIEIYEFNEGGELTLFTEAREAKPESDGHWLLKDVMRKRFKGFEVEMEQHAILRWDAFLSPTQGAVIQLDIDTLAPSDLYLYARDLRSRGQRADRYELALWRKLNVPFATLAMVLLSIPFVFGPHDRGGIGRPVLFGASVGVLFYVGEQLFTQIGLLADIKPALTATAPAAFLLVVALILMRRVY